MTTAIQTLIGRPVANVFRRLEIKRRQSNNGKFESSWLDITDFVEKWGQFDAAIDDVSLNHFTYSGFTIVMRNDGGDFNPETNGNSLWNGYLTRYGTLVRVQAGYYDSAGNEAPADTTQGIYLTSAEIPISGETNEATLECKSLASIFDEVRAVDVSGLGPTQSASDLITRIRDHSDGSGNNIFREYITSTSWTIQTTTAQYNLASSTSDLANLTCWDLMTKLAEAEGFVILINRGGGVEFRNRAERSSTSTFELYGQGFPEMNVIGIPEIKEPWDRLYNFFRLKYLTEDTLTSYVEAGTTTAIDPANRSWKYGQRIYEFQNTFFVDTTTAQAAVDSLFSSFAFGSAPIDVTVICKFLPSVEVLDRIGVSYHSFDFLGTTLWDFFNWDEANWDSEAGENINWDSKAFRIASKQTNLDNFTTTLKLQEIQ